MNIENIYKQWHDNIKDYYKNSIIFGGTPEEFKDKIESILGYCKNEEQVFKILDLYNKYTYWLVLNEKKANKKTQREEQKLKKIIDNFDNDVIKYLEDNINLKEVFEKAFMNGQELHEGEIHIMLSLFLQSLKVLDKQNNAYKYEKIGKNIKSIPHGYSNTWLKNKTIVHNRQIGDKALLKAMLFEIMFYCKINKKNSISIIYNLFSVSLSDRHTDESFNADFEKLLLDMNEEELINYYNEQRYKENKTKEFKYLNEIFRVFDTFDCNWINS